jgi:hypothetical protein
MLKFIILFCIWNIWKKIITKDPEITPEQRISTFGRCRPTKQTETQFGDQFSTKTLQ